jgi:transposase-like protein
VEIRQVICSTNAIESLNARYRRAVKARGHFPTEQAPGVSSTGQRNTSMTEVLCEHWRAAGDSGRGAA